MKELAMGLPQTTTQVDCFARHLAVGVHLNRHGVGSPVGRGDLNAEQLAVGGLPRRLAGQAADSRAELLA
jgi:hypothetical protein